jgi:signal peptidase I
VRTARHFVTQMLSVMLLGTVVLGGLALIVVPKATGSRPLTVLTGSMTPTYTPGDVVIVRPADVDDLQIGDVITFQAVSDDPRLTTHRITSVMLTSEGRQYVTQGDANGAVDPAPIKPEQVRGTVWYSVPYVGYAATWAAGGTLRLLINVAAGGLLLYGGFMVAAGALDRRRRRIEVPS